MAKELKVMPRKLDQPVIADKIMTQGTHVRSGTDNRVDAGNSATYVVTKGVEYLQLVAAAAIWVRVSPRGATSSDAEAGKDQFLASGDTLEVYNVYDGVSYRRLAEGDFVKCVVDS